MSFVKPIITLCYISSVTRGKLLTGLGVFEGKWKGFSRSTTLTAVKRKKI